MNQTLLNWSWCFSDPGGVLAIGKCCPNSFPGRSTQDVSLTNDLHQASCTQTEPAEPEAEERLGIPSGTAHQCLLHPSALWDCSNRDYTMLTKRCPRKAQDDCQNKGDAAFQQGCSSCPISTPRPGSEEPYHAQEQTHPVCRDEL